MIKSSAVVQSSVSRLPGENYRDWTNRILLHKKQILDESRLLQKKQKAGSKMPEMNKDKKNELEEKTEKKIVQSQKPILSNTHVHASKKAAMKANNGVMDDEDISFISPQSTQPTLTREHQQNRHHISNIKRASLEERVAWRVRRRSIHDLIKLIRVVTQTSSHSPAVNELLLQELMKQEYDNGVTSFIASMKELTSKMIREAVAPNQSLPQPEKVKHELALLHTRINREINSNIRCSIESIRNGIQNCIPRRGFQMFAETLLAPSGGYQRSSRFVMKLLLNLPDLPLLCPWIGDPHLPTLDHMRRALHTSLPPDTIDDEEEDGLFPTSITPSTCVRRSSSTNVSHSHRDRSDVQSDILPPISRRNVVLPDAVLIHALSFLDAGELGVMGRVSSTWWNALARPSTNGPSGGGGIPIAIGEDIGIQECEWFTGICSSIRIASTLGLSRILKCHSTRSSTLRPSFPNLDYIFYSQYRDMETRKEFEAREATYKKVDDIIASDPRTWSSLWGFPVINHDDDGKGEERPIYMSYMAMVSLDGLRRIMNYSPSTMRFLLVDYTIKEFMNGVDTTDDSLGVDLLESCSGADTTVIVRIDEGKIPYATSPSEIAVQIGAKIATLLPFVRRIAFIYLSHFADSTNTEEERNSDQQHAMELFSELIRESPDRRPTFALRLIRRPFDSAWSAHRVSGPYNRYWWASQMIRGEVETIEALLIAQSQMSSHSLVFDM